MKKKEFNDFMQDISTHYGLSYVNKDGYLSFDRIEKLSLVGKILTVLDILDEYDVFVESVKENEKIFYSISAIMKEPEFIINIHEFGKK